MCESLKRQQYRFAAYLRDPDRAPPVDGVSPRRMAVYAEIFFNNISAQIAAGFPVIRAITPDAAWNGLIRDFMRHHRCRTPLFNQVGDEFLEFLQSAPGQARDDPPFLLELAHYERVELALYIDDDASDRRGVDPNGDLLAGRPVISALAWPLAYRFDVHRIGIDYQPAQPPAAPTYLVVYRDRHEAVRFSEINAVTYQLLMLLASEQAPLTGREAAQRIAEQLQHPRPEVVIQGAAEILNDLRRREIVLGAAPV